MQQLELFTGGKTLRGALAHLLAFALECTDWTRKMHTDHARYLVDWFGDVPLVDITYAKIREYLADKKRAGLAVETIRKYLCTLHMALEEALRMGWLDKVPPWPVMKSDSRPKKDFWSVGEWEQANLGCDDEDLAMFVALGFWLGSHTSDIYRLRWCDVDLVAGTWIRRNTKSKIEPVPLPIPDRLRPLLEARAELSQPHRRDLVCGRNMGHPNRQIRALALRCGIPSIRPIGLRHSCVTRMKEQGCDDDYRSYWIGHRSVVVTKKVYTHMTAKQIAAGAAKANAPS